MDQASLQPHYLTELRQSGIFTEGDLLELEDHFFTIYEAELDSGQSAQLALQRAEQALGKREEVIAAFAQKRRWAWARDLGSFFVFGLVVNSLSLWCLGIGVNNLFSIISHGTNLNNLAPVLMPGLMISFILFVASWQWKLLRNSADLPGKLPQFFERIKLKFIVLLILIPLVLSLLTDPMIIHIISNKVILTWESTEYGTNLKLWQHFYSLSMTILIAFFGSQAYQHYQQNKHTAMLWALRMGIFFMAGLSLPLFSALNSYLFEVLSFRDYDTLLHWFIIINYILVGIEIGLMLLFPFAYRYIWQRKQYLA